MVSEPTVYVVDDDPGSLRSLCWLMEQDGLPVRGFGSAEEFFRGYRPDEPGCLVLDVRMPEMGGLAVQKKLAEDGAELPIIFITAYGDVPTCAQAMKAGAADFLEKPVDGRTLLDLVRKASALAAARNLRRRTAAQFAAHFNQLTPRERCVFDMLVAGKTLKEAAGAAGVAVQTIWKQRLSIFRKMGVETGAELLRLAAEWERERHP